MVRHHSQYRNFISSFSLLLITHTRIETAFPPATAHGLGWGPVQTSTVMGANSVLLFVLMVLVMFLSVKKIHDSALVITGNCIWLIGGALMYFLWTYQAPVSHFVVPIMVTVSGFPFIASANRSNYTKAVKKKPDLEAFQSMMQAIMSMGASVGGFVAPAFVATFVLRSPEEVDASTDKHELNPIALYVPVTCAICIAALVYEWMTREEEDKFEDAIEEEAELTMPTEKSGLMKKGRISKRRSTALEIAQEFSRRTEANRRQSVEIMGVACPYESSDEHNLREKMWHDKKEWDEIHRLGDESEWASSEFHDW